MTEPIITPMRQYATHLIEQCYQGKLLELNGEPDHIHILFELPATAAPSVVVCSLKTQLSKEVRAKFWDEIKDKLWKDSFWCVAYNKSTRYRRQNSPVSEREFLKIGKGHVEAK